VVIVGWGRLEHPHAGGHTRQPGKTPGILPDPGSKQIQRQRREWRDSISIIAPFQANRALARAEGGQVEPVLDP